MDRERLDARDSMPADIRAYLEKNGWSFSKKMCEFAVSRMKDRDGKKIEPITKEQIDKLLKTNGIELKHDNGYDCVYVANRPGPITGDHPLPMNNTWPCSSRISSTMKTPIPGCPSHDISPI